MSPPDPKVLTVSVEEWHVLSALSGVTTPPLLGARIPEALPDAVFEAVVRGLVAHGLIEEVETDSGPRVGRIPMQVLGMVSEAAVELDAWAATDAGSSELCVLRVGDAAILIEPRNGILSVSLVSVDDALDAVYVTTGAKTTTVSRVEAVTLTADSLEQGRSALDADDRASATELLGAEGLDLVSAHEGTCRVTIQRANGEADCESLTWLDCGDVGRYRFDPAASDSAMVTLEPLTTPEIVELVSGAVGLP